MLLQSCAEPNSIKFDFGATAASDGVLASTFIREPRGKQFAKKICVLNSRTLSEGCANILQLLGNKFIRCLHLDRLSPVKGKSRQLR